MGIIRAPIFRFGEDVDTDVIVPGPYLKLTYEQAAPHVMEGVRPGFAEALAIAGGIIVAGANFGCGSSREAAPAALKCAGVQAIVAPFFARIFFRNAINIGLPVVECPPVVASPLVEGDTLIIDLDGGVITAPQKQMEWTFPALPSRIQEIVAAGGLVPYVKGQRDSRLGGNS